MAERLPLVPAPDQLWHAVEEQIRRQKIPVESMPKRNLVPAFALAAGIVILIATLFWFFRASEENRGVTAAAPQWSVNATVIEACSCP